MMQAAQFNPVGHGQALTAQILSQAAQQPMQQIRTVAPNQLQSRAFNAMDEVQKERAFNRDFYKQQDQQQASLALEAERNANALNRQRLADKSALERIELQDKKAIAPGGY